MNEQLPIFVYGTLKRGQPRQSQWPHPPLRIVPATTVGRLFDFGDYPGLVTGDQQVAGELWYVAADHLEQTLLTLDQIEDFRGQDDDLYKRIIVECDVGGLFQWAFTYLYHQALPLQAIEVQADPAGVQRWPVQLGSHR